MPAVPPPRRIIRRPVIFNRNAVCKIQPPVHHLRRVHFLRPLTQHIIRRIQHRHRLPIPHPHLDPLFERHNLPSRLLCHQPPSSGLRKIPSPRSASRAISFRHIATSIP